MSNPLGNFKYLIVLARDSGKVPFDRYSVLTDKEFVMQSLCATWRTPTTTTMPLRIVQVDSSLVELMNEHLGRHLAESGRYNTHWLPYDPAKLEVQPAVSLSGLERGFDEVGWQRWYAVLGEDGSVVGHLDLKGSRFDRTLHRGEFGMGLEYAYWRQGLGKDLLEIAIELTTSIASIDWLDLHVLSCNEPAHRLYLRYGFREISRIPDFCRIEESPIDDIFMSLWVGRPGGA